MTQVRLQQGRCVAGSIAAVHGYGALIEGSLLLAIRRPFLNLVGVVPLTAATALPFAIAIIVFGVVLICAGLARKTLARKK